MEIRLPRLLIIDDEPDSIALLLAFLDDFSIDIIVSRNGEDGFQKAISEKPDLIFLDVVMPGLDGFKLCQRLKLNPLTADIPVIFLSGRVELHDKLAGFNVGCIDYITKPFSEAEVVARITAHLRNIKRLSSQNSIDLSVLDFKIAANDLNFSARLIEQALQYLKDHLAAPPGLIELAHKIGTNERKLTEIFRERLGMTVFDYHFQLRMELACRLLKETNLSILIIAQNCGYQNAGDFTRAFRRQFGVNPSNYRGNKGMVLQKGDS